MRFVKNCPEKLHSKDTDTRAVHSWSRGPVDTSGDKGTIPGRCHPFGALHRHHRVNLIFTQC